MLFIQLNASLKLINLEAFPHFLRFIHFIYLTILLIISTQLELMGSSLKLF